MRRSCRDQYAWEQQLKPRIGPQISHFGSTVLNVDAQQMRHRNSCLTMPRFQILDSDKILQRTILRWETSQRSTEQPCISSDQQMLLH